jgi:hypothetical protein
VPSTRGCSQSGCVPDGRSFNCMSRETKRENRPLSLPLYSICLCLYLCLLYLYHLSIYLSVSCINLYLYPCLFISTS